MTKINAVHIQTIRNCNLRCKFCANAYRELDKKIMSMDDFKAIIDSLNVSNVLAYNNSFFLWLQNEPFMDPLIFERIDYIKKINKYNKIEFNTNGMMSTEYLDRLENDRKINKVRFNLYGYDNYDDFKKITQSSIKEEDFIKKIERIKRIVESNSVKFEIKKELIEDYNNIEYAKTSRAGFLFDSFNKTDGEELKIKCDRPNKVLLNNRYHYYENYRPEKDYSKWLHILVDGTIILCCFDYTQKYTLGNILEDSIENILNSTKYRKIIKMMKGELLSKKDFPCRNCEYGKKI